MGEHAIDVEALLAEQGWLRALARRLVHDEATADDLVQETWLAALRKPPEAGRPLRPWLARVLSNFAKMRSRHERGLAHRERAAARSDALPDTTHLVARAEIQRNVAGLVLELDEPYRSTLLMRYFEGLSSAEIARRSGAPAGTVRWRLKQGVDRLRERLDGEHGDRAAWCALLAPVAGIPAPVGTPPSAGPSVGPSAGPSAGPAAAAASGAGAAGGSTLPKLAAGLLLATGVAGVALLAGPLLRDGSGRAPLAPAGSTGPLAARGPAAARAPADPDGSSRAPRSAEFGVPARAVAQAPEVPEATAAAGEREGVLEARVLAPAIGSDGASPAVGARVELRGAGGAHTSGASDADGRVRLALRAPAASFGELFDLAIEMAGARLERRVALVTDAPNALGDLELEAVGGVAGRVTDEAGLALEGARVRLEPLPSRWQYTRGSEPLEDARIFGSMLPADARSAVTGPDGRFAFSACAVGHVRLWADLDGRVGAYGEPVGVRAGQTVEAPALVLAVPHEAQVLAGRVLGPGGDHIALAEIEISRSSTRSAFFRGEPWVVRARAGPDGRFRAVVGSFPNYDVAVRDPSGVLGDALIRRLPRARRDVEVELERARVVGISVRSPRGEEFAIPDVRFFDELHRLPLPVRPALSTHLGDPEGPGGMLWLAPAVPYRVRVERAGYEPVELGPFDPAHGDSIVVRLRAAKALTGRVRAAGRAVAGAEVELIPALAEGQALHADVTADGTAFGLWADLGAAAASGQRVVAEEDGRFELDVTAEGRFFLRAAAPGFAPALAGPVDLRPGREPRSLDVELTLGGALAGTVRVAEGRSPAGRLVAVSRGDGYVTSARTDAEGRFAIAGLAPGGWQVRELREPLRATGWAALDGAPIATVPGEPAWDVVVREGEVTDLELDWSRPRAAQIAGRLLLGGGPPGAWLVLLESADGAVRLDTGLDADGRFRLRAPAPGRYRLSIWNTGLRPIAMGMFDTLELGAGENAWERDVATGELVLEGLPGGRDLLYLVWEGEGELWSSTLIAPQEASGDALRLPHAPAGRLKLVRCRGEHGAVDPREGRVVQRLELGAGESRLVRVR